MYCLLTLLLLGGRGSSRFSRDLIRGKQMASQAAMDYQLYQLHSNQFVLFGISARAHSITELKEAFTNEIKKLQTDPVSEEELKRVKAQVIAQNIYNQDSLMNQAMDIGGAEVIGLSWQSSQDYVKNIEAVTAKQIQQVAQLYLIPRHLTIGVLQPTGEPTQPPRSAVIGGVTLMCLLIVIISLFISLNLFASESTPLVNIQHWDTKNGAKVYFVRASEIPMLDIQVVFAAGSSYDGQAWGLASFTNSMLAEGTATQNADQIAAAFDRVGAQYPNGVDRDMAMLSLRSLTRPDFLKPALKAFADVLVGPTFPQKAFIRVKHQLLSNIEYNEQSPNVVASKAFYSAIYGTHPYSHPPEGTIKTINAITNDEVKSFYQKFYVANNANVVIVGDLTCKQAQGIAAQVIGALPTGKPVPVLPKAITASGMLRRQIPF